MSAIATSRFVPLMLLPLISIGISSGDRPGRDRYLLLDQRIIESAENARLTVGTVTKSPKNPLFVEDKPWEARFDNLYANVVFDEAEQIYKCWYSPFIVDRSARGMTFQQRLSERYRPPKNREMGVCLATSKDGLKWEKPSLGIVNFGGNADNNLVYRRSSANVHEPHGAGIFKDTHDPDSNRRYKMFFKGEIISVAFSADGIHWGEGIPCPEANVRGDTHNNSLWAPTREEYVGITRMFSKPRGRQVARVTSPDFLKWTKAEVVLEGLEDHLQTYSMPVFYHGGIYLGLVSIFNTKTDRTHTELAWSPDTLQWKRVAPGRPLIPCGVDEGSYDWGCVYAAAYPVFEEDHIRLYYGGSDGLHTGYRNGSFCLASLRPDGFAGYEHRETGSSATITTKPIKTGDVFQLNADVEPGGFVDVTFCDVHGDALGRSKRITKTAVNSPVTWEPSGALPESAQITFTFSGATIYSFAWN